ncbi:MAG TPA: tetratricopeptide repeat protein [Rectinemataceae bacterium]|nr:tetratricopeptide repeat protein [Rectinemataceae bacterium]
MFAFFRLAALSLTLLLSLPIIGQTDPGAEAAASQASLSPPAVTAPAVTPPPANQAAVSQAAVAQPTGQEQQAPAAQPKADALLLYIQGRNLDDAGKTADAKSLYNKAITICDGELKSDPRRLDAYAVKCWCLFRLGRHQDVIDVGAAASKIVFDPRIAEVMGESYFFLGKNDLAIQSFGKYLESGKFSDRISTAYFYLGELYFRQAKWSHADIAYTTAVRLEPSMARWWSRLGQVSERLGDWQRAADSYSKALSLSPGMQDATDGLSRAKSKLGT